MCSIVDRLCESIAGDEQITRYLAVMWSDLCMLE